MKGMGGFKKAAKVAVKAKGKMANPFMAMVKKTMMGAKKKK